MTSNDIVNKLRTSISYLNLEIEKTRFKAQDSTLGQISHEINSIPSSSTQFIRHKILKGHGDKVSNICWSSNGNDLYSASQDGLMICWDPVSGYKKDYVSLKNPWVLTSAISNDLQLLALAGLDNACSIYKVSNHHQYQGKNNISSNSNNNGDNNSTISVRVIFEGHTAYISDCTFNTNNTIITSSGDMTCALWDCNKGGKVRNFIEHLGDVLCVSQVNNDNPLDNGNIFVSGSSDGYAKVWDCRQQNSVQSFRTPGGYDVNSIKMFPNGYAFVTGADDGTLRLYDIRSDCELEVYDINNKYLAFVAENHHKYKSLSSTNLPGRSLGGDSCNNSLISTFITKGITSIDFSILGRLLFACYEEIGCIVWDTLKIKPLSMIGDSKTINKVKVSPDGLAIATSQFDPSINIWTLKNLNI